MRHWVQKWRGGDNRTFKKLSLVGIAEILLWAAVTFENTTIVYLNTPIRVRVCAKRIDCWISMYQFTRTEEGGRATHNRLRRGMVLESAQLVHFLSTAFVCFPHGWKLFSYGLCKWQDISTRYQLLKTQGSYDSHLRSSVAVLKRWK